MPNVGKVVKYAKRILNFYGKGKHKYVYAKKAGSVAKKISSTAKTGIKLTAKNKWKFKRGLM